MIEVRQEQKLNRPRPRRPLHWCIYRDGQYRRSTADYDEAMEMAAAMAGEDEEVVVVEATPEVIVDSEDREQRFATWVDQQEALAQHRGEALAELDEGGE